MTGLDVLLQFLLNGIVTGSVYVLIAVGLTLIFGILGVVNFAHGEFYMLGGYIGITATTLLGLPLLPACAVVALALAALGIAAERVVFRPLAGRDPTSSIVASFGLAVVLQNAALLVFGAQPQLLRTPWARVPLHLGPAVITGQRALIPVVMVVLMTALGLLLRFTWTGRALRAMAQHPTLAQISGIDIRRVAVVTFAAAAALAGAAGALMSSVLLVQPTSGNLMVLKAFTVVILGGMGSVAGAVVAGLGLGIVESLVSAYLGNGLRDIVGFLVVIAVLLVRPQGLLGRVTARA
ncbi:MAG: branched-chain amino acid ABC transporter permease [Rhodospirillales bacterium]|nr:branched-chain amino acid ABC transporter permease [Rhodospirillales bacterium]